MKSSIDRLRKSFSFLALVLSIFSLLALATGARAGSTAASQAATPLAAPSALLATRVERELAKAPIEGAALAAVYRSQVRSLEEAATFFYSASFLRLDLGGQQQVIEAALGRDPAGFLPQTEFLPVSLREEYRQRAHQAAEQRETAASAPLALGLAQIR